MDLIARHLNEKNLKIPIYDGINGMCAFSGIPLTRGVLLDDLISDVFTDWEFVKYKSQYCSVEIALCISEVIQGKSSFNSLRNYSFMATESQLQLLQRNEILDKFMNIHECPFRCGVTFNNKKHLSFKTVLNTDASNFIVSTDIMGNVRFDVNIVKAILPIAQKWYSVIQGKETSSAQPTYFTKDEILYGNAPYKKQEFYGFEQYEHENEILKQYRNTNFFKLLIHILNKK